VDSRNIPPLLAGMGPVAAADWFNSMTVTSPVDGDEVRHPSAPGAFLPCFLHDPSGNPDARGSQDQYVQSRVK
jgi:hypothetical protein